MRRHALSADLVATATAVLLLSASLAARQQPAPQATPAFRSGVELVRLDVRVQDADGRAVTDLEPGEIEITEGGEPRPVVLFQRVAEPGGSYLEVARRTVGAEISTNQGSARGHLYVLVFDQNHIRAGNEQRARQAAERFLRRHVRTGDRVALHALPGPGPQVPFSNQVLPVINELSRVRGSLDRESFGPAGTMSIFEAFQVTRGDQQVVQRIITRAAETGGSLDISARPASARGNAGNITPEDPRLAAQIVLDSARSVVSRADAEARVFLTSLADVVKGLADFDGRKTVILVSEGFFTDNLVHEVEHVAAMAARSYAVIHSLDVNARGIDVGASQPSGGEPAAEIQSRLEALGTLASETDGELVLDANSEPDRAFNRIAAQSQDYYIVGFAPPPEALAARDRYRRISVRVRRPGTRVSARTGYSLRDPATGADRRRAIDLALAAPFPQQGLPLRLTTYVLRGTTPGAHRVFMSLEADLPAALNADAGRVDVVFVARNVRDGRVVASGTDTMAVPGAAAGARPAPGRFNVQFEAPPGEYLMRAVVREPGGATGSVDRRFEVRHLDGMDLTASDLVLGSRSPQLPVRATAHIEDGLSGALELYARRREDIERAEVRVSLLPLDGETAVVSLAASLQEVRPVGAGVARTATLDIPLREVAPGEYLVRAEVRARGEAVIELVRQVQVFRGTAPAAPASPGEALSPRLILQGALARDFVESLGGGAEDRAFLEARAAAASGAWDKVAVILGRPVPGAASRVAALHGLAMFAAGDYSAAVASLSGALAAGPRSPELTFLLGWVHALAGDNNEATTAWRNSVRLDPKLIPGYLALAEMYVRLAHPELAVQVLREGLRANPASVELAGKLAEVERR